MLATVQYQNMQNPGGAGRTLLLLSAILGWLGLVLQLIVSARLSANTGRSPFAGVLDALCYFTVLTNLLAAIDATVGVTGDTGFFASAGTRAATAVYIFVVGLIYTLLLRTLWAPAGLHKIADAILHDLVPLAYTVWWVGFAPKGGLRWVQPLRWLAYPLAYFAFSVVLDRSPAAIFIRSSTSARSGSQRCFAMRCCSGCSSGSWAWPRSDSIALSPARSAYRNKGAGAGGAPHPPRPQPAFRQPLGP